MFCWFSKYTVVFSNIVSMLIPRRWPPCPNFRVVFSKRCDSPWKFSGKACVIVFLRLDMRGQQRRVFMEFLRLYCEKPYFFLWSVFQWVMNRFFLIIYKQINDLFLNFCEIVILSSSFQIGWRKVVFKMEEYYVLLKYFDNDKTRQNSCHYYFQI